MDMPKEHPRAKKTRMAGAEAGIALAKALAPFKLTPIETIRVVMTVCNNYVADVTKTMLRLERHGDAERPADFE